MVWSNFTIYIFRFTKITSPICGRDLCKAENINSEICGVAKPESLNHKIRDLRYVNV